jgi:di/tricarboxylate transporter
VALVGMTLVAMFLSAFMNNTPVVVILTPIVFMLARALNMAPSRMLIPLSYAAVLGGTTTLIGTSTNLLVNGVLAQQGMPAISMFEITGVGIVACLVGALYMAVFGRWLLPDRKSMIVDQPSRAFLTEMLVPQGSPFVGKTLAEAGLTPERGAEVIDVIRAHRSRRIVRHHLKLDPGDRLVVRTKVADVMGLREADQLLFGTREEHRIEPIESQETVIMEGVVGPASRLIGYRLADLNFRRLYGVYIMAIHRQGKELEENFDEIQLEAGDALLLEGPPDGLRRLFERRVLVNLTTPGERPFRRDKAPIAIGAIVLVMVLATLDAFPIEVLALIAAGVVVATGCITADEAYESIQWRVLMLIFGTLALGLALEKTGAARLIVDNLALLAAGMGPIVILAMIYLITMVLTEIASNNATAVLITPIAIGLAQHLGVDPRPFVMAVLFAASWGFATPIGYQTNTFVYGVGGYKFTDFVKVGVPLNLLCFAIAMVLIPWFWPLTK